MPPPIAIEGRDRDEFTISPICSAAIIPRGDSCIFSMKFEPLLVTGSLANLVITAADFILIGAAVKAIIAAGGK